MRRSLIGAALAVSLLPLSTPALASPPTDTQIVVDDFVGPFDATGGVICAAGTVVLGILPGLVLRFADLRDLTGALGG